MSRLESAHDWLFTLRVSPFVGDVPIMIYAFDANHTDHHTGHVRIDVIVRHCGKTIFKRGDTYCAVNRWTAIDGIAARELVMSLVARKPGDTDQDYFASYTPEQLAFAEKYGDALSCEREARYRDPETGAIRGNK